MLAVKGTTPQNIESGRVLVILIAIALVIYWRTALKAIIMILAVALIAALGSGAVALLQGMHHATPK